MLKKNHSQFLVALLLAASSQVLSHGRYVLPSHSNLSSDSPDIITIDISISNDFFHPDMSYGGEAIVENHDPMVQMTAANSQFVVVTPAGRKETDHRLLDLGRKSVGAVTMDEDGTYKIAMVQQPTYMTIFTNPEGSPSRFPGKKKDLANKIPVGSKGLRTMEITGRTETYVSRNQLTRNVISTSGVGLELAGGTHPNDLFMGESATFEFFLNGAPVPKGVAVNLTLGNTRYRNDRDVLELTTDDHGAVIVEWPSAGVYLMEIDTSAAPSSKDADMASTSLYITFDVNPE